MKFVIIPTFAPLSICFQEIPVVGYDKWFKLEPRSSASKVQGECHLILRLFTTQVLLFIRDPAALIKWIFHANMKICCSFIHPCDIFRTGFLFGSTLKKIVHWNCGAWLFIKCSSTITSTLGVIKTYTGKSKIDIFVAATDTSWWNYWSVQETEHYLQHYYI